MNTQSFSFRAILSMGVMLIVSIVILYFHGNMTNWQIFTLATLGVLFISDTGELVKRYFPQAS